MKTPSVSCLLAVALSTSSMAETTVKTYTYKTAGDLKIKADVYRPGDKLLTQTVIVFVTA